MLWGKENRLYSSRNLLCGFSCSQNKNPDFCYGLQSPSHLSSFSLTPPCRCSPLIQPPTRASFLTVSQTCLGPSAVDLSRAGLSSENNKAITIFTRAAVITHRRHTSSGL